MLFALAFLTFATPRFALTEFERGSGIDESTYRAVVDSIAGEVRKSTQAQLITPEEIKSLLSAEEQKQLLGCSASECLAEIGGALGAERILTGSLAKTGRSYVLFIKAVHTKKIGDVKQVSRRFKDGDIDDVLDAIPAAVKELFGASAPAPVEPPTGAAFDPERAVRNTEHKDAQNIRQRVRLFGDGQGHYLAVEPKIGTNALMFYGSAAGLYHQRVSSGGRNGTRHDYTFWEPRIADGWRHSVTVDGDEASVTCDDETRRFVALSAKDSAPALKAPLFAARVPYAMVALAADANGIYYYLDRDTRLAENKGHRLFVGKKGKLALFSVDDVLDAANGTRFITSGGTLTIGDKRAEWNSGALEPLSVFGASRMIFTELGVYPRALGTPCDR